MFIKSAARLSEKCWKCLRAGHGLRLCYTVDNDKAGNKSRMTTCTSKTLDKLISAIVFRVCGDNLLVAWIVVCA
jgi:hypothetical protein